MTPIKKKFLSIVPYAFLPAHTGGQKAIALFNQYFSEQAPLYCITTKENDNSLASYPTIPLLSRGKSRYLDVRNFFTIRNFIRDHQITHLILEHPYLGWLAVMLKNRTGVQLIVRSHNIEHIRWKQLGKWWSPILFRYEKWVHRRADLNLFITDQDKAVAQKTFGLNPELCVTATYGIEISSPPSASEKANALASLTKQYDLKAGDTVILFNGAFNYPPNLKALKAVLYGINPLLQQQGSLRYKIIICGKFLPDEYLYSTGFPNVIFAGFVDDMTLYLKAARMFINPIDEGGGIKTKLVEALAYDLNCVSFVSGAIGIPAQAAAGKLHLVNDGDVALFSKQIIEADAGQQSVIPSSFYKWFYWPNIISKVLNAVPDR